MQELKSDKGREFDCDVFNDACELLKTKHLLSIAYRHQSNSHVERSIRSVRDYLALLNSQDNLNWQDALPYAITAYNTSYHSAIHNIPHYLFYGRDHVFNMTDALSNAPIYNADENIAAEMKACWKKALEVAQNFVDKQHQTNKKLYDKKAHPHNLKVNDVIFIKNMAPDNKQVDKYKGPYRITEFVSRNVIKAKLIGARKIIETHTDFVKFGRLPDSLDNINK